MGVEEIKTFLGKKPLKVLRNYLSLSKDEINSIRSVNTYLMNHPITKEIDVSKLNMGGVGNMKIGSASPVVYSSNDDIYLPLKITLQIPTPRMFEKVPRMGPYFTAGVFFINGIGARPDLKYIMGHYMDLLSSNCSGTAHNLLAGCGNTDGRYVVCLDNASRPYLKYLLDFTVKGNGKVVDYSWISLLQNLIEEQDLKEDKANKAKISKNNGINPYLEHSLIEDVEPENDGDFDDIDDPLTIQSNNYKNATESLLKDLAAAGKIRARPTSFRTKYVPKGPAYYGTPGQDPTSPPISSFIHQLNNDASF